MLDIMGDLNNNGEHSADTFDVITIRNQADVIKVNYIKNLLSQTAIPGNFQPNWKTNNIRKLFFRTNDGKESKREYVLFENDKFYCAYCVCFARKVNRFVEGVDYTQGCRMVDGLNKHETSAHHKLAEKNFLKANSDLPRENCSKREVLRILIKIIIFIATHG